MHHVKFMLSSFAPRQGLPSRKSIDLLKTIRHLLELVRFSHTLFALPFALLAAVMAWRLQFIEGKKALETPPIDDEQFQQLLGTMVKDLGRFLDWPVIGKWQGFAIRCSLGF